MRDGELQALDDAIEHVQWTERRVKAALQEAEAVLANANRAWWLAPIDCLRLWFEVRKLKRRMGD